MSEYVYCSHGEPLINDSGEIALAREEIVRCRDCKDYEDTGNCYFWASFEPIPAGDEYREVLAEVTPNGYCAWGERRGNDS